MNKFISTLLIILSLILPVNVIYANSTEAIETNVPSNAKKEITELPYNYSSTDFVPIKLAITKEISTKDALLEGETLEFRVIQDVIYNDTVILKEGDIIKGKLETIVTSGMNGFPAELHVDNFEIPNVKQSQLLSAYTKKGQNRCLWVYPLKWSLTLIPFVGSLTNLIMGGHAKIKTTDIITIYYFPNWR